MLYRRRGGARGGAAPAGGGRPCHRGGTRGSGHLARLGIQPDLALGDFDSLGYVPEAPSVEVCPVRKDDTDTMAALKRAHELGFRRVLIFGGLGGGAL